MFRVKTVIEILDNGKVWNMFWQYFFFSVQYEIRDREKQREEEYRRQNPDAPVNLKQSIKQKYIEEFLPPPEPE